jgi:hypothetical protein
VLKWAKTIDWMAIGASALCLVAFLLVIPPPSQPSQTVDQSYQDSDSVSPPASPDERLADYTFGLEVFTAALVVIGIFEIILLFRTDKTSRWTVKAALRQTIIARRQMGLSSLQSDILEKEKEIQRQQFMTQYRPRLRVRNIVILPPESSGDNVPLTFHGQWWSGSFVVENFGGTSCVVLESHVMLFANQMGLPMQAPYDTDEPNNVIVGHFNTGESVTFPITQRSPLATDGEADRAFAGHFPLFVMGWARYRDESTGGIMDGVSYRVVFCRQWDRSARRFLPVGNDPDYEYEG